MPTPLSPSDLSTLGLSSPALGPWFSTATNIGEPAANLSATVTLTASTNWLPPAPGVLGLFIGGSTPPLAIATLKDASGASPFPAGQLVGVFRLLPEVEERLDALLRFVPPVTAAAPSSPPSTPAATATRARVRWLALQFPASFLTSGSSPMDALWPCIPPPAAPSSVSDDSARAQYLGLKLTGSTLFNGSIPMSDLRRPGQYTLATGSPGSDQLLQALPAGDYTLWAFDSRGGAIDPGAVAAWWSYLGQSVFSNLWATGVTWPDSSNQVVCPASAKLSVHLVNPHEGPLAAPLLDGRLTLTGADSGSGVVRSSSGTPPLSLQFGAASDPTVDDAPLPRVALLPSGTYGSSVSLWPSGAVGTLLARDFVRVAAVDVERHLVGQARGNASATPADKDAADQNRASTRVLVGRATNAGSVLQPTIDAATGALLGVFDAAAPRRLVTSVITRGWGALGFDATTFASSVALPDAALPDDVTEGGSTAPFYVAHALAGGDVNIAGATRGQRVLVEFTLDASLAGAWVRVWPEGFDDQNGVHVRLDGGGGRVRSDGKAYVVATLADYGPISSAAPAAVNMMLVTARGSRIYADKRFDRPALPSPDTPAVLGASTHWYLCETGDDATGASLGSRFVGGMSVVVDQGGGSWAIVDPASLQPGDLAATTIGSKLAATDIVELTQPAFRATPDRLYPTGDPAPGSSTTGDPLDGLGAHAIVDLCTRRTLTDMLTNPLKPGEPFATMDRLEIAAATVNTTGTSAALAAASALGPYHELLPHDLGHPGAPGAVETHATGVRLEGPAAVGLIEAVRDRTAGLGLSFFASLPDAVKPFLVRSTPLLVAEAATTVLPTVPATMPTDTGVWAAVLRTVAAGVEGEPGGASGLVASGLYPFSVTDTTIHNWLTNTVIPMINALPSGSSVVTPLQNALNTIHPNEDSVARALDRRVKAGAFGLREAAFSIKAAFDRAEELVYLETPALDHTTCGPTGTAADPIDVWQALISRAGTRPGLRILVCAALHLQPGSPRALEDVRTAMMLDALDELRRACGDERLAVFYPSAATGRSLRLASTTVVVDDAWAITGTTHLWRRGLSFDSSLAAAVFDDRLEQGRPVEVRDFRRRLVAGRLGLPLSLVPDDAGELVSAVNALTQGGSSRVTVTLPTQPQPFLTPTGATVNDYPTSVPSSSESVSDRDTWNPNGADTTVTVTSLIDALRRSTAGTGVDDTVNPAS